MELNKLLQQAAVAHQQGKLDEAERLYRDILKTEPKHPETTHNLGILIDSQKKSQEICKQKKQQQKKN